MRLLQVGEAGLLSTAWVLSLLAGCTLYNTIFIADILLPKFAEKTFVLIDWAGEDSSSVVESLKQ